MNACKSVMCSTASVLLLVLIATNTSFAQSFPGLGLAVDDPSAHLGYLTMPGGEKVRYYRTSPLNKRNSEVTHALIVIHGNSRRAYRTWLNAVTAAQAAGVDDRTLILAPHFIGEDDAREPTEPFWKGGWKQDDLSRDGSLISSFSVVDHIFEKLCVADRFPNLQTIVLAGHSAGGQFTNRYAAAGQAWVRDGVWLRFVVMNPSSYLYLNDQRVADEYFDYFQYTPTTDGYNNYKYGLENLNTYAGLVGVNTLRDNLVSRETYYLCGTNDTSTTDESLDVTAPAKVQGDHRLDRFYRYEVHVANYQDPTWQSNAMFMPVAGIGHSESGMFQSIVGTFLMFQ